MSEVMPAHLSRGEGDPTLFLLHGIGGSKEYWSLDLEVFANAGYRAVALDLPGYGDSKTIEPYTLSGLARSLERLIDSIAPKRVVLLGHSMGGMIVLEAWAAYPHKIVGLILSGTSPAFGKPDGAWQQEFLRRRLGPLDEGQSMSDLAPRLVRAMVAPDTAPAGVQRAIEIMSAVPPQTYRSALYALMSFDRRALLPAISVPTLALAGQLDPNAPPALMQKMAEKIPGATYECLPRAGHLASLEQPAAFADAVLRFLHARFR
jgi:pimeloyl-ACP methyl ester carboxylesterase